MDALPICGRRTTGRFVILSGLISASALSSGCASSPARSMAKMWDDLPKVRWSMSRDATDKELDESQIAAKPSAKADESTANSGSTLANRFGFSSWTTDSKKDAAETNREPPAVTKKHSRPHDPFLADDLGRVHIASKPAEEDAEDDDESESPKVASHRDRLKAALSDDSRRNREPEADPAEQDRLRVRVEALMVRATELFEQGELIPAQRTADLAQNLADECGLEFSPDEERPVDLLARIDAGLEALAAEQAAAKDAQNADAATASADFAADRSLDFDPYVNRRQLPERKRKSFFDSALVVLEAPSFEEVDTEPAVSPTAYAPHEDQSPATLPFTRGNAAALPAAETEVEETPAQPETAAPELPSSAETKIAEPPAMQGPSFGEIDMPSLEDDTPAPRPASKKRTAGTVTLRDMDADDSDEDAPAEEIHRAEAIPRWLLLSCLSVFAGAFSVWLIRRHVQGAV